MLSRKSLGVAGAALLGTMTLMAANTANAVIVAGGEGTHTDVKIAKETLLGTTTGDNPTATVIDSVKYYHITDAGQALDIVGTTVISPSTSLPIYLRFQLENMIFASAISGTVTGGGAKDNFAVMSYNTGSATDARTLDVGTLGVLPDKAGSVTVTAHVSALDALRNKDEINTKPQKAENVVMVVDGLKETGTSSKAVAEVADGFTQFVGTGTGKQTPPAGIGTLSVADTTGVATRALADVTAPSALLDDTDPITITFKGDFSEHTYTLSNTTSCPGSVASSLNAGKTVLTPDTQPDASAAVTYRLCVSVAADNKKAITSAPFMATVKYTAIDDAAFPRAEQTVEVGRIGRNGTSIHIPYLTTHDSYNQRVVIVNRGGDTKYSFDELESDGATEPTAGTMASGDLSMGQTVLRSTDIVAGATRAAATLNIVADPSNISAAIQQVNLSDGSVDTVYLESSGM